MLPFGRRARHVSTRPVPWALPWIRGYYDATIGANTTTWVPVVGSQNITWTDIALANGIYTFNGTSSVGTTAAFTLNQPFTAGVVLNQVSWTQGRRVVASKSGNYNVLIDQETATPNTLRFTADGGANVLTRLLATGTFGIATYVGNGANSLAGLNLSFTSVGQTGANNPGGWTLGARGDGADEFSNVQMKGFFYCDTALTAAQLTQTVQAMGRRYGISV